MIFSAYLGTEQGIPAWRAATARHADWLGLSVRAGSLPAGAGRMFHFAWIGPASPGGRDDIPSHADRQRGILSHVLTTSGEIAAAQGNVRAMLTDPRQPAAIRIALTPSGGLLAAVPPAAVEQLCYARVPGGWILGNDLRLLARIAGAELDETGILGLFRYGLTPAPMTPFRNVQRIPVGHLLRILPGSEEAVLEPFARLGDPADREPEAARPEDYIRNTLDEILLRAPHSPVVYFSGGVDSSLIAARMAALGRSDTILLNFSFGPGDEQANRAARLAGQLGLRFERLEWNPAGIPEVLQRLGRDYPFPFCDTALIPGNLLVHAALPIAESSRTTLHGVGAGPVFGQTVQIRRLWRPIEWMPRLLRKTLSEPYRALKLWRRDSWLALPMSVLRRSAQVPVVHARMNEHALEGIAYVAPSNAGNRLNSEIRDHVEVLAARRDYDLLTGTLLQMYFPSRDFSAISLGPQMARGVESIAPFMEPWMLQRGFALTWDEKCPGGVPKGLLRNLLAKSLPPACDEVSGGSFIAPHREVYTHAAMRAFIQETMLSPDNPLLEFCDANIVREMAARLQNGQPLALGARKFMWTLAFASGWLRQAA